MIPDQNIDLREGIKSMRNGNYMNKYIVFCYLNFYKGYLVSREWGEGRINKQKKENF